MKVYISIPIAGKDITAQREYASDVAWLLAKFGHEPFDPFCNGLPEESPREEHMRKDLHHVPSKRGMRRMLRQVHCRGQKRHVSRPNLLAAGPRPHGAAV